MVVAPLSANTLAKIVAGMSDNSITSMTDPSTDGSVDGLRDRFRDFGQESYGKRKGLSRRE